MKVVIALSMALCLVFASFGCNQGFKPGETKIVYQAPPISVTNRNAEFGIYPGGYTVYNYVNTAIANVTFTIFNNLDFASPGTIMIYYPTQNALLKNKCQAWQDSIIYCNPLDSGAEVPAHSSRTTTVRVMVPDGISPPRNWMFYVAYQSEGHRWGNYLTTLANNFIFIPGGFQVVQDGSPDVKQRLSWETWGNNPEVIVRMKYDTPPMSIDDGVLAYQGLGIQIIKPWVDPNTGKLLNRQYTLYDFTKNEALPSSGGTKLFFRAWQKHLVYGVWDGTWDALGQSMVVPEVQAKVIVNMA